MRTPRAGSFAFHDLLLVYATDKISLRVRAAAALWPRRDGFYFIFHSARRAHFYYCRFLLRIIRYDDEYAALAPLFIRELARTRTWMMTSPMPRRNDGRHVRCGVDSLT